MFYKVSEVMPLPDYRLLVSFATGEKKQYNVKPLFDSWEPFKALLITKGLFEQVQVDTGGYGVSWNNDIDISCAVITMRIRILTSWCLRTLKQAKPEFSELR